MRAFAFGPGVRRWRAAAGGSPTPTPAPSPAPTPAPTPTPAVAIAAINPEGWSAEWASGTPAAFAPDTAPQGVTVQRRGFDASGAPVVREATRLFTRRKRRPYPDQASDTATTVALDDYVYATDTIAGVANNSTEQSPKPIAAWVMPDRLVVGNALAWELVAFHRDFRDNRQVAAVIVTASDGTASVSQTVATTVISSLCEDANPIEVYRGEIDISDLAAGLVTLNAKVLPWVGADAAILHSADQSAPREFSPRYFRKDPARAAAPPLAYVATGGSDASGVWSGSAATAAATPFASVQGAINAIAAQTGATGGIVDGCRVRIGSGTFALASAGSTRTQAIAALVIERDPAVARAAAVVQLASSYRPRLGGALVVPLSEGALLFRDVTISRTAAVTFAGETATPLALSFWNVAITNSAASSIHSMSHAAWFGAVWTGYNGNLAGAAEQRLWRGLTVDVALTAYQQWVTVGCTLTRAITSPKLDPTRGTIFYANRFLNPAATTTPFGIAAANAGDTVAGIVAVQNLFEATHTTASTNGLAIGNDGLNGNTLHSVIAHNTMTGYAGIARANLFYDESSGTNRRSHRLVRDVGNIYVQLNTKGDVFHGNADPAEAPYRIGQFAYHHGVGCHGNIAQFRVAASAAFSEAQAYAGRGSRIGTQALEPQFAPATLWRDYRGTTGSGGTATAGAGGGDYTLAPGSPARGIVATSGLGFDLAGAARSRSGADAAGAYA